MTTNLEQYLTYKDIAKRLSRSTNTIKRWSSENYLGFPPPSYLGRNAVFREVDIVAWVKNQLSGNFSGASQQQKARSALAINRAST
jgi:predicted DNA-binding transcriptional regulator AlpA